MLTFVAPGGFVVPTPASGRVAVTAGIGNWAGTRTELIAAAEAQTQSDFFIVGYIFGGPGTYSAFRLYIGASNGTLLHEEPVEAIANAKQKFLLPILVAGGSRISTDIMVSSGSAPCTMALMCVSRLNLMDDSAIATGMLIGTVTPVTNVVTDLATMPANRFANGVVVMVANQGAQDQAVRVAVSPLGATYSPDHDIMTWAIVKAGSTLPVPIPFMLQGTDKIRVWTNGNANITQLVATGFGTLTPVAVTTTTSIIFSVTSPTIG